jgi:hypothetical protein
MAARVVHSQCVAENCALLQPKIARP